MRAQNRLLATLAFGLVLAVALVAAVGATGLGVRDGDVIAVIDGVEVTRLDWEWVQVQLAANEEMLRQVQSGDLELSDDLDAPMSRVAAALEDVGRGTDLQERALGILMLRFATRSALVESGILPDDDAVAAEVAAVHAQTEQFLSDDESDSLRLFQFNYDHTVRVIGEARYWTKIKPEEVRIALAQDRLIAERDLDIEEWTKSALGAGQQATVQLRGETLASVSLNAARAYIEEYQAFVETQSAAMSERAQP